MDNVDLNSILTSGLGAYTANVQSSAAEANKKAADANAKAAAANSKKWVLPAIIGGVVLFVVVFVFMRRK